jgi:predicted GNAT family acetyltransferase
MITIKQRDNGIDGMFFAVNDGQEIAEMSYFWDGDDTIVIASTKVADKYQNQGVGKKMVAECVDFARKEDVRIYPQCAFARQIFAQTPEYKDVLLR